MTKRILALVLSGVMLLSTGCGLSSHTKDKLFGDSDVTNTVESAVRTGNFELLDEYFEANKISQDLLNECLNVAVYADDPYESMLYLLGKGADPNNDNIIWDLAYSARVEAMRALLTSDDVDLTEKNEVGHDALYMAGYISGDTRKVTTHRLVEMKQRGEKISMLTSYDYTTAQIVDGAGIDVILVGDSASNVMAGNVTTLPITLDQMIYHGKSVVRGVKRALVVVDLPFGTYQTSEYEAVTNAIKVMKITHADALKLEGGVEIIDAVKKIIAAGIPIMGHLGLMPQSINKYGTYTVRAKDEEEAEKLLSDAHLLEEAGCFALVLEKIPASLAERVAKELTIPVIGIGAGGAVDGQVLVVSDMLGMTNGFSPRFLRRYADLHTVMTGAIQQYVDDVKKGDFPNEDEQY